MSTNKLLQWVKLATPDERRKLCEFAGTTYEAFLQMAGAYRTKGIVSVKPETARDLELASAQFPTLPALQREDLCLACGKCELAKIARTVKIVPL